MLSYFHCMGALLSPGSIIEPGNWGRMVRSYRPKDGNAEAAFREMILEAERRVVAPMKPSRLDAVFTCPSDTELWAFMQSSGRTREVAYEVVPVDDAAPLHQADHNLPLFAAGVPYFDSFAARARAYWTARPPAQNVEVLIGGPVRVLRRLS